MLGPDGVGKSTMKAQLLNRLAPIFPNYKTYHFRPRIIGRIGPGRPISKPHSMKARGKIASVLYLLTVFTDYWLGYILQIRPLLKRSSLVVLDRYFHDLLIDPVRYRYGAPMWLARGLRRLIPPRDVFFLILDAQENVIYSRKQELPFQEVVRQRKAYVAWAEAHPNSLLVRTDCSAEECAAEAAAGILKYLHRRAGKHAGPTPATLEREAAADHS
jgi:thymidylate kinase